ncbi:MULTISPECIES: NIL domain-containing protein [unclassified Nodularia (in: cyanobacteria)]|uniref:NIL domain-containing protein n=1 Tax=unclassified Nodularia (in: cyanobacteria) TaxID=2656917 RepID=UPI001880FA06|nr:MULTISPECIES: NIL domain-containing protein [unclassified Nodularia (in: cyanobacteria)]MBE9201691.1 NIL domain-containing protein [Nodularia sp. LEGE 06071]MCC2691281.1 NIL domain-containing protein [Nodularia sp. LEGE 04288]
MPHKKLHPLTPIDSRIRIPLHYHRQPLISRLVSRFGVTVNIKAAMLSATDSHGWFDLQLQGNSEHIYDGLLYLQNLGVDLMDTSITESVPHNFSFLSFPRPTPEMTTPAPSYTYPVYGSQSYRLGLQICILKDYYQTPIIFDLVSRYGITVNIIGASLPANQQEDGWFDLDLWGKPQQLFSSCDYLEKLKLPLWLDASSLHGQII